MLYGQGTSYEGELIDIGSALGVVVKSGSWYSYKGERIGQGKEKTRQYFKEHPEVAKEVEEIIRDNMANITFVPAKGSKAGNIEVRKGVQIDLNGDSFFSPEQPAAPLADDLTDVDIDVEADVDDFE